MPSNKKKKSDSSSLPTRSRTFTMELYPEWENYTNILAYIHGYEYAYIVHDKDVANDETGELKKTHAHVVIKYRSRRTLTSVKTDFKKIGVPDNLINTCNEKAMIRYLLHLDDPEKYPYPKSEVRTNMLKTCEMYWAETIESEEAFLIINTYIEESQKPITQTELNNYAIKNGLLKGLKAYGSQIRDARIEKNKLLENTLRETDIAERERVRMRKEIADGEERAKEKIAEFVTVADATGFEIINVDGHKYRLERLEDTNKPSVFDEKIEQIDMLKEGRKK